MNVIDKSSPFDAIDPTDTSTWPEIKVLKQYYNDLIFDNFDDTRVPFWESELRLLKEMEQRGETIYIPH